MNNQENYSNKIRNDIKRIIDETINMSDSVLDACNFIATALSDYYDKLNCYGNEKEREAFLILYSLIAQPAYVDAVKIANYKSKKMTSTDDEDIIYADLLDINSVTDLNEILNYDPLLLGIILKYFYDYTNFRDLRKALHIRSLSDNENIRLSQIAPIHDIDLKYYGKKSIITFEELITEFIKERVYYSEFGYNDYETRAIESLEEFLKELFIVDNYNATMLLQELASKDYTYSKYLCKHGYDIECLENHIKVYENDDLVEILNKFITDKFFLFDALYTVTSVLVFKTYATLNINENDIEIDDDKQVIRKLKKSK